MISHEELTTILAYEHETGLFRWKVKRPCIRVGDVAGTRHYDGYIRVWTGMKRYYAHRLAWFYVHGEWPTEEIDHVNGIRDDNRLENLRPATRIENCNNSVHKDKALRACRPIYKRRKRQPVRGAGHQQP